MFDLPAIRPFEILSDGEKTERNRRLEIIYDRRKRNRKLVEKQLLQEQCAELQGDQKELEEELIWTI